MNYLCLIYKIHVQPILHSKEHLQLLFRENNDSDVAYANVGHWVCIYHINEDLKM